MSAKIRKLKPKKCKPSIFKLEAHDTPLSDGNGIRVNFEGMGLINDGTQMQVTFINPANGQKIPYIIPSKVEWEQIQELCIGKGVYWYLVLKEPETKVKSATKTKVINEKIYRNN